MAVVALADYLPRMGVAEQAAPADVTAPAVDAVAEAVSAARSAAESEHAARIEELRKEHEAAMARALADARSAWAAEEGERLSTGIADAIDQIESSLADATARVLVPFLATAARRLAVEDLTGRIRQILRDGSPAAIRITGPADLLAALEMQLGDLSSAIAFEPADAVEVTVRADRTIIASQIGAWVDQLWKEADAHG